MFVPYVAPLLQRFIDSVSIRITLNNYYLLHQTKVDTRLLYIVLANDRIFFGR